MKLRQSFNTKNNKPIYVIEGNTYNIRTWLGKSELGFNWYGEKKIWWMYKENVTPKMIERLKSLGVDTSEYNISSTAPVQSQSPSSKIPTQSEENNIPNLTNKTDVDTQDKNYNRIPGESYMGFKVKRNIYETDIEVIFENNKIPLHIVLDRWYVRGRRRIPSYVYNVFYKNQQIYSVSMKPPGSAEWGQYNEDELALKIPEFVQKIIDLKKELYKSIQYFTAIEKREPEFKQFLEEWGKTFGKEKSEFIDKYIPQKTIEINDPEYQGTFKITPYLLGNSVYLETKVDNEIAPSPHNLIRMDFPVEIINLQQFNDYMEKFIIEHHDEIQEKYVEYLKSFPFKKEDEEQSRQDMIEVINMIGNNYDVNFFKNKLIEYGYIRPNKKVKQEDKVHGFMPQDQIKWVIESKKIVDDVYKPIRSPEQFYSIIAYWLHRKVKNISSWTEMMLTWAINDWVRLSKKYGHPITIDQIDTYFDKVSSLLYTTLFNRQPPKSRADQYADFNNWFNGSESSTGNTGPTITIDDPSALKALVNFMEYAVYLGANFEMAKLNPLKTYRELAKKYHPDVSDDPEAEAKFKKLSVLFNKIPSNAVRVSWYSKVFRKYN